MQLYYNASKIYRTPTPADKGQLLKCDIRELRIRPGKLTNRYQEQEQEAARPKTLQCDEKQGKFDNATHDWLNYKEKLGEALPQIYPLRKKQTRPEEPEWVAKLEKWGTGQEIRQLDYAYKKR